jgi:hypothetical protein
MRMDDNSVLIRAATNIWFLPVPFLFATMIKDGSGNGGMRAEIPLTYYASF